MNILVLIGLTQFFDQSAYADLTSDYGALTDGAPSATVGCCLGSVVVFGTSAFPILVEPTGNRRVAVAAGYHSDLQTGARGVAFSHDQWTTASDGRIEPFR